jgi:2-methylcitrate dehydratase PrpD
MRPSVPTISPFSSQMFARYASALQFAHVPSDVSKLCKLILLDSVGVAAAATGVMKSTSLVASYAKATFGEGISPIWGCKTAVTPMGAAFANGALSHALNYDVLGAGYAGLIPPAVMAAADCNEMTSGQEALTAMVVGIELLTRIQDAASALPKSYNRTLDGQLQTYFGCAAAAAKVMGLSAEQIESALGLALMQAAGSMQITLDGDAEAKAFYGAFPNQAGLQSALLAREGLSASCNALSGPAGLFPLFYGLPGCDEVVLAGLGREYGMRRARFKRWPTSAAFAELIVAALDIKAKERVQPEKIDRIQIMTAPTMRVWFEPNAVRCAPTNAASAGNSAPFVIAVVLANGTFSLNDLGPSGLAQPSVLRVANAIEVQFNQTIGAPSRMLISTIDGSQFERSIELTPGLTLPWLGEDQVRTKFKTCLRHARDQNLSAREDEIISLIEHFEQLDDCRHLSRIFTTTT